MRAESFAKRHSAHLSARLTTWREANRKISHTFKQDVAKRTIQRLADSLQWIPFNKSEELLQARNIVDIQGDICFVPNMEDELDNRPFLEMVFDPSELAYAMRFSRPGERLAARFAVKEAVWKLLNGCDLHEVVVSHDQERKPFIILEGETKEKAEKLGVAVNLVAISHDGDYAMAICASTQQEIDPDPIDILQW